MREARTNEDDSKRLILNIIRHENAPISLREIVSKVNEDQPEEKLSFLQAKRAIFSLANESKVHLTSGYLVTRPNK